MKYHILLGILLWTAGAALAQLSVPTLDTSRSPEAKPSAPSLKKKPSSHGKSGKPAAPLAKPEFGEETEIQEESPEEEESEDCDGCLLAGRMQTPIGYDVARLPTMKGSVAPGQHRESGAQETKSSASAPKSQPGSPALPASAANTLWLLFLVRVRRGIPRPHVPGTCLK